MSDALYDSMYDKCACTDMEVCERCLKGLKQSKYYCLHCGTKLYYNIP